MQRECFFTKGPFIKDVINQGGGGFAKRWSYLISLFSKSDDEGGGGSKISKNWWRLLWIERPLWLNIFGSLCVNFWGVYYRGGGLLREKRSSTRDRLRTSKTVDVEWSDIVREQILQVGGMLRTQLSSLLIAFHWKSSSYLEVQLRQANPDIRVGNSMQ